MALSGPKALRALDDAIKDIRREENDIAKRLSRSAERLGKIQESEAELYRKLAAVRLDERVQREIDSKLTRAEREARDELKSHAAQVAESEKLLKELDRDIATLAKERNRALKELDGAQEKLKGISSRIAEVIERDPTYQKKRAEAEALQAIAEESIKKTEQAEADQEKKGRPYRDDPLFMYLWEAGYGTQNYRANNLIRWLDGMVARFIRYREARPNFAMLNEIPLRLREHAEAQMARAKQAEDALDRMEQAAIEKAGGKPLADAIEKARQRLEELDRKMLEAENLRDQQAEKMRELAQGNQPAFVRARDNLAQALQSRELGELVAEARKTATREDDALLSKISQIRARALDENKEADELGKRLKVIEQRRRELEDIEWEFKKSRFDDPRSQFRKDDLVGDLLGEFLRGAITAATYWNHWQRSQNWRADTRNWGGSIGLPRSGRRDNFGSTRMRNSQYNNRPKGRSPWGNLPGVTPSGRPSGGEFSRPRPSTRPPSRSGTRGNRRSGGFKTGGGF